MTNGQVQCFMAVVEEGSFAKAASSLFISQPAISKSVSKLEDELGAELLERRMGMVVTTAAGQMLYNFLKRSGDEFQSLLKSIKQAQMEPSGIVTVGCPETWNPAKFYNKIMDHFNAKFPLIRLELECHRLPSLMSRLQNGKIDILMTHEFHPQVLYGFTVRHLTDTDCGILYSNAYFNNINSLADLSGADFLHFDSSIEKRIGSVIKKICGEYGFSPNLKNCGQFSSALFNMSCGKGVMFFTEWDNAVANASYSYLPLGYVSPVNIIYRNASSNNGVNLVADELVKLFAQE